MTWFKYFHTTLFFLLFEFTSAIAYTEPIDFDVVNALSDHGVNVTQSVPSINRSGGSTRPFCQIACHALEIRFGPDYVLSPDETPYNSFVDGYWSAIQEETRPSCIFKAPDKNAVSVFILISRYTGCPVAAKSGGHAAFGESSNIEGGITLSLELLNHIKVSPDRKTVSVGPGNTWSRVYSELEKYDLAVIGGRVSRIGVGGLTLGGGISFFSSIYGWACDNVATYEVITATGQTIIASPKHNFDLYWGLRGGGNNFGLVVNFNLFAIDLPGGDMWGGTRTFTEPSFDMLTETFSELVANSYTDRNAGQWVAWLQDNGTKIASTELWYAKPNGDQAAIFKNINNITPGPIADTTANIKLATYSEQLQQVNPYGLRESFYCLTVKADVKLAHAARDIFYEEIPAVSKVSEALPVMIYQGITQPQLKAMSRYGGNPLGLHTDGPPLYLILLVCRWRKASDDEAVYSMLSRIVSRIKEESVVSNASSDYLYMNYASVYQDVIRSYGAVNKAHLKRIAKRYDPAEVWQRLQPGYFKLDHAPVVDDRYFSG